MTDEEQDAYVAKYRAKIQEWEADLEKLKAQAAEASADARIELDQQIAQLRATTENQRHKLDALEQAGRGAWADVKATFESAWQDAQDAWKRVQTHLN